MSHGMLQSLIVHSLTRRNGTRIRPIEVPTWLMVAIFDLKGNYNDDYNVQIHDLLHLNDVNATIYNDDYDQEISVAAAESANLVNGIQAVGSRTNIGPVKTHRKINYKAL
jgi:hypothetical protein